MEQSDNLLKIERNEKDENIYSDEGRESLVDNGEISTAEEGFMEGEVGEVTKCSNCDKELVDESQTIEKEIGGKLCRFCSDKCVLEFEEKSQNISEEE